MPEVGERPARDPDPRVDFVAAVPAREPERELSVGTNLRITGGQRGIRHEDVAVLDGQVGAAGSPHDVPGAEALAVQRALDPRALERLEQHAVELAIAAHRDRAGRRPERGHDAGEHAIAFLPVQAGHVERDARLLAIRGLTFELDVGSARGHPALLEPNPLRVERVDDLARDRHVAERQMRVERPGLVGERAELGDEVGGQLACHGPHVGRRLDVRFAVTGLERPLAERPLEPVPARRPPRHAQPFDLEKIREPHEIDALVFHVPRRPGRRRLAKRRHAVVEPRRPTVDLTRGVGDFQPIGNPQHGSTQVGEPPVVDTRDAADKRPLQLASTLEEMKGPGEIPDARNVELLPVKEDVLLGRKVDV